MDASEIFGSVRTNDVRCASPPTVVHAPPPRHPSPTPRRHVPARKQRRPLPSAPLLSNPDGNSSFAFSISSNTVEGASPLELPHTLTRQPLRRLAPFPWPPF